MIPFVTVVVVAEAVLYGLRPAALALASGITMVVILECVTTPVTDALFLHLHSRSGVPLYCDHDERAAPTAIAWHRAIMSLACCYALVAVVFALASLSPVSLGDLLVWSMIYLGGWVLLFVGVPALFDWLHFLGHRRHYRKEMAALESERAMERARVEATEVDQRFWGVVRDYRKSGPGEVA